MKICFKCRIKKELTEFYKHPQMPDGRVNKCKECNKKDVKVNYKKKKKYYTEYDKNRYRTNIKRLFESKYSAMKTRVNGTGSHKTSAEGKELLPKNEFIAWCFSELSIQQFMPIYQKWKDSGYKNKIAPSIDRIDNSIGYTKENLQWLTLQKNTSKYNK